jgi:hypothetical protein
MDRQARASNVSDKDERTPDQERPQPVEMSVDEAVEVYANEWIFMAITKQDERGHPLRCIVLDHHPRQEQIQPTVRRVITEIKVTGKAPEHVRAYQVMYGVRLFRTAAEWEDYKRRTGWPEGKHGRRP